MATHNDKLQSGTAHILCSIACRAVFCRCMQSRHEGLRPTALSKWYHPVNSHRSIN